MTIKVIKGVARDGGYKITDRMNVTKKELFILKRIGNGFSTEELGAKLGLSATTVKSHVFNIRKKLGAKSRAHALVIAIQKNMLAIRADDLAQIKPDDFVLCGDCAQAYTWDEAVQVQPDKCVINHLEYTPPAYESCPYCGAAFDPENTWADVKRLFPHYPEIPMRNMPYLQAVSGIFEEEAQEPECV